MKDAGQESRFVVNSKNIRVYSPLMATVRFFGRSLVGPSLFLASLRKSWEKQFFHSPRQLNIKKVYIKKVKLTLLTKNGYRHSIEL